MVPLSHAEKRNHFFFTKTVTLVLVMTLIIAKLMQRRRIPHIIYVILEL